MTADPPPRGYALRRMEPRDLDDVLTIERVSQSKPWNEDAFRHEIDGNPFSRPVVALPRRDPASVAGFCIHWVVFDSAHLQNVAVHPSHRKVGLGRRLVESALMDAEAAGAEAIDLEVRPSNVAARRLYESLGFRAVGERCGYYSSPREDALCLRLRLPRDA